MKGCAANLLIRVIIKGLLKSDLFIESSINDFASALIVIMVERKGTYRMNWFFTLESMIKISS